MPDPCPRWLDPADEQPIIEANLAAIAKGIVAGGQRSVPHANMPLAWHRRMLVGTTVPALYRGALRGPPSTCLNQPVAVGVLGAGGLAGVAPGQVERQVKVMRRELISRLKALDAAFPPAYALTASDTLDVLDLAAWTHGEWIRIHPFIDGNGRTARLWGHWVSSRYGLPPFLDGRPRPSHPDFGTAAAASMTGDHNAMALVFADLFSHLGGQKP